MHITMVRVHDDRHDRAEGQRVLVDRLWPRGVSKESLPLDECAKDVAPSNELRTAYHAGDVDHGEFRRRFLAELDASGAAAALRDRLDARRRVVLLTSAKDVDTSHVPVIAEALEDAG